MPYKPQIKKLDYYEEGSGGSDKWADLDSNKLEPTDSARKQIHLGGENSFSDTILPGASLLSVSNDGGTAATVIETYNTTSTQGANLVGLRGRGTKSSPSGVLANDILFAFGSSGITANGNNGFLLGQFGGFVVSAAADATNTTIPMSISITSPEGDVIKTHPGRNVFIGSGSVTPTEKVGIRGRIELEGGTAPTANTNFGKIWYNSSDKKLYFMDDTGADYDLTTSTNGFQYTGDSENTGTYVYIGYEHSDGRWYIYRRTVASGDRLYASGASSYATNWTNRASLSYA